MMRGVYIKGRPIRAVVSWPFRMLRALVRSLCESGIKLTLHKSKRKLRQMRGQLFSKADQHAEETAAQPAVTQDTAAVEISLRQQRYEYHKKLSPGERVEAIKAWYEYYTGKKLNLENPQTYNEKIQWFKLYGYTPLVSKLVDKYLVREWVLRRIGEKYLVPLLGVWNRPEDIAFEDLPDRYVLKATHGCGYNIIVSDKNSVDQNKVREQLSAWLAEDFAYVAGFEMFYSQIQPRVVAEKYLNNLENDLFDYKVFCFHGKAEFIEFISGRKYEPRMTIFDCDWNKLSITTQTYLPHEDAVEKPDNLKEIIRCAEVLANGFPHVRVDFYRMDDGTIYFGEMTFTPTSGTARWYPPETDLELGKKFKYMGM